MTNKPGRTMQAVTGAAVQLFWSFFTPAAPVPRTTARPSRSTRSSSTAKVGELDEPMTAVAAKLLRGIGCGQLADRVAVCWHHRLSSTAGLARAESATVLLNPRLKDFRGEVDRTLRHELAHLVAGERAGRRRISAHGPEWRRACAELGIENESRCHTLPLPRRQQTRNHLYRCPRCAYELRRVRPINVRRRRLACSDCCRRYAAGRFDRRFEFKKIL